MMLTSVVFILLSVVLDAAAARFARRLGPVMRYAFFFVICGLSLLVLLICQERPFWAPVLLYGLLGELYVFLFTLVANSVSMGIVMRLRYGAISETEIYEYYDPNAMVLRRLEHLQNAKLIHPALGGWTLSSRGRALILVFERLRSFFRRPLRGGGG